MPPTKRPRVVIIESRADYTRFLAAIAITNADTVATLSDKVEQAEAAIRYITENVSALRGKLTPDTPTTASTTLQTKVQNLRQAIKDRQSQLTKDQNLASRVIIKRDKVRHAGDGDCYIHFVNVGMGDCTLISTPLGIRIMIDCGSTAMSDVVLDPKLLAGNATPEQCIANTLKSELFLDGGKTIDLLCLTHPDEDHHDKLQTLLEPLGVKAQVVYYGGAEAITAFASSGYLKEMCGTGTNDLRMVILREEENMVLGTIAVTKTVNSNSVPTTDGESKKLLREFIDSRGAMVIYYESEGGSDFRLSIIAGNTPGVWTNWNDKDVFVKRDDWLKTLGEMALEATDANKRSLMLLIECFGKRILVCGDATAVTETFATKYFTAPLGTVQYLRMGHHGSPTSSSQQFIDALTGMTTAVASTGGAKTTVHHLPKKKIIGLYQTKTADGAGEHSIYAFDQGDTVAQACFPDGTRQVFATGSNDTYQFSLSKPTLDVVEP